MNVPHIIDFETDGIEDYPHYPPAPVGVSIIESGSSVPYYMAFGHAGLDNTHTREQVKKKLKELWKDDCAFYNASFDIEVADVEFGLGMPSGYHDVMFLAFLEDPRAVSIGLKQQAVERLGMNPNEQDRLRRWILKNIEGTHEAKNSKHPRMHYMNFMRDAPVALVGKYANGDTRRTLRLFKMLMPSIVKQGMTGAYIRELELLPTIMEMERYGLLINLKLLKKDAQAYEKAIEKLADKIYAKLGGRTKNKKGEVWKISSGQALGKRLKEFKKLKYIPKTEKGNFSTSKESLEDAMKDLELLKLIQLYNKLNDCLNNFMHPWIEKAAKTGGILHPKFHQTRGREEGKGGTRTGRLSSTDPNFQALNRNPEPDEVKKFKGLLRRLRVELPQMRKYVLPRKGKIFIKRDYSQQEPRILAHYEQDVLYRAYNENPKADVYRLCMKIIYDATGISIERYEMKVLVLAIIYGLGVAAIAMKIKCTVEHAKKLKKVVRNAIPGIAKLNKEIRAIANKDEPIRTWGGRLYYCEPALIDEWTGAIIRTFEYKLLNILIQGGAADCTKEAMIRCTYAADKNSDIGFKIVMQVHDELVAEVNTTHKKKGLELMREAMDGVEFDVPMRSDGFVGKNLGLLKEVA